MVPSVAFTGVVSVTAKLSFGSTSVSPVIGMEMRWLVTPGSKVRVPVRAVKSLSAVAVPLTVA